MIVIGIAGMMLAGCGSGDLSGDWTTDGDARVQEFTIEGDLTGEGSFTLLEELPNGNIQIVDRECSVTASRLEDSSASRRYRLDIRAVRVNAFETPCVII